MIQGTVETLAALGVSRSRSWVMRTIRAWQRSTVRMPFGPVLLAKLQLNEQRRADLARDPKLQYLTELGYMDPTGVQAVQNVTRKQQRGRSR